MLLKEKQLLCKNFNVPEDQGLYIKAESRSVIISLLTCKDIYNLFKWKYFKKPTALGKWEEKGYFFSECIWKYYNKLPYLVTRDTKIQSLQYKILHRFFPCRYWLSKWNNDADEFCEWCSVVDNLEHYFTHCLISKSFWSSVFNWFKAVTAVSIKLSDHEILFGIENNEKDNILFLLNFVILQGKFFIVKCKNYKTNPSLLEFLRELKLNLQIERNIAINNKTTDLLEKKWGLLFDTL